MNKPSNAYLITFIIIGAVSLFFGMATLGVARVRSSKEALRIKTEQQKFDNLHSNSESLIYCGNELIYCGNEAIIIKIIDNHEYIIYKGYKKGGICHKVNCKFCSKKRN